MDGEESCDDEGVIVCVGQPVSRAFNRVAEERRNLPSHTPPPPQCEDEMPMTDLFMT